MEKEKVFYILGIGKTHNEEEIRGAYYALLKETNPEDDPEGFKRLRQAYEEALMYARQQEEEEEPEGPKGAVEEWILEIQEFYDDLPSRHKVEAWKHLLDNPVCDDLDTSLEAREKFLVFLMNNYQLPHEVYKLIDKKFFISGDLEGLKEKFPYNFLNYIIYYMENETFLPYEHFTYRNPDNPNVNGDAYINEYLKLKQELDEDRIEDAKRTIEDIQAYNIYHPYEDGEQARLLAKEGKPQEAQTLMEKMLETHSGECYLMYCMGQIKRDAGQKEEADAYWKAILKDLPQHYMAKLYHAEYLMEQEMFHESWEYLMELLDVNGRDEVMVEVLRKTNEGLIRQIQEKIENGQTDERLPGDMLTIRLAQCYFQNERDKEALEILKAFQPQEPERIQYLSLYGRVLLKSEKYEEALLYLNKWVEALNNYEDDGSEEYQKQIKRRGQAHYCIGCCYQQLEQIPEAVAAIEKAIELTEKQEQMAYRQFMADLLLKDKQFEKVIDICDDIIREDEGYYPAYVVRQEAAYELKNGQQVINDYHRAIEIYPGYYKPYLFAAEVFYHVNQYEDALEVLKCATENKIEYTSRMKLCKAKILRHLAQSKKEREEPFAILEELCREIMKEDCDIQDKSEIDFEKSMLYWDDEDMEAALEFILEAIRKNPDNMTYHLLCGNIYLDRKQYEKALQKYEVAEKEYAEDPMLIYNRGVCYEHMEYEKEAIRDYEKVLEMEGVYWQACVKVARYYRDKYKEKHRKEDFERAISYMNRQVEQAEGEEENPYYPYYLNERGLIYLDGYCLDEAEKDFRKVLDIDPRDWAAWNNLGNCYRFAGEPKKALEYYMKAVQYIGDTQTVVPYNNMLECYETMREYEKGIECCRKLLIQFPYNKNFIETMGDFFFKMGRYNEAMECYAQAPDSICHPRNICSVWIEKGKPKKAISIMKRAVANASYSEKSQKYEEFGMMYMEELLDYSKAIECLKKAAEYKKSPLKLFSLHCGIARAYYMCKDYEKAKEHANIALEYLKQGYPNWEEEFLQYKSHAPMAHGKMGWIYLCLGKEEEALEYFRKAEQMKPCKVCNSRGCYESRLFMGMFYENQGRFDKALIEYEIALKRNPDGVETKGILRDFKKRKEQYDRRN